ncbi:MAG: citryl-CoA lyase [Aquabacterium sp.]|uniref:citryl-CoA lyase n=1 Tax=Aquabacterium sp. TaxID=1872578 RepID=UPI0025C1F387|nr:citryl-CoA lyase [Aquabacterium sp.]MBI5925252.1 citryl-CoA lyase [Aquabacterium sp.]
MSGSPLHTRIWHEEPEVDNPFATRTARCHGYDVYGHMLGRARWADMVWLLIKGEAPSISEAAMLDALAVALANPGPRDPMVHAAMCGGVGGSPAAASLMAALAVGAGQSGGARDVYLSMRLWARCDALTPSDWIDTLTHTRPPTWLAPDDAGWPAIEHPAGFDANGVSTPTVVLKSLVTLAGLSQGPRLAWMVSQRDVLERAAGLPLAMTGVAAAALADMGFHARQGEMLFLLLRLPGAAAHALEQADYGFKHFPYPDVDLLDDPLNKHKETPA